MSGFTENTEEKENKKNKVSLSVKLLALYFALMPFDSIALFGMGSLLRIIALLPVAAIVFVERNSRIKIMPLVNRVFLYTLFILLSILYSIDISESASAALRLLVNILLVICIGGMKNDYNRHEYEILKKALVVGGLATVVLTYMFSDTSANGRLTLSIAGSTQDQNYINGYSLFAAAYFLKKLIKDRKVIAAVPVLFIVVFTIMTGSRGALLATVAVGVTSLFYIFFVDKNINPITLIITLLVVVTFRLTYEKLLSLVAPQVLERFSLEFIANYRGINRNVLWGYLLDVYKESNFFRQLFGYGFNTVPLINSLTHQVAHNIWLEILISNGAIGLISLLALQATMVKEALRSGDVVLISALVGLLGMCLTLSLVYYKPIWNLLMMIMIDYHIRYKNESSQYR